jgi:ribosome maturation factor RimP
MQRAPRAITECVEPVVTGLGYQLVGVEYGGGRGNGILRVYIDAEAGIEVDDCAAVSERLSAALDVDDPVPDAYTLEVSSPGVNRPLFAAADFRRFAGERAFVRVAAGAIPEGRKRFKGVLGGLDGADVLIEVDGEDWRLPFDAVEEAHLVVDV